ncbi:hypothetical protein CRV02_12325 [Arcobacter sp. CECT 8989]|uniref:redoxin domain-containing protein n=1 Tax=Arcobacter sp. CECT 8989 TaxID=2044509 RepID=UPI00100C0D4F|nr:redoxin domain-containing protein [Arcobacter sp. CECT 8989]RXJ98976.1 hypothetical protein CRV02_12325 [Arcobacter sp. CECT 8989]
MITKKEYLKLKAVDILNEKIERKITPIGELLPKHTVETFNGDSININLMYKDKPLLLIFMRASWCPYCRGYMEMLDGMGEYFKSLGCNIAVVSREEPEESTFSSEHVTLISDTTNSFGKKLNMTYFATDEITKIYETLGIKERVEGYWDTSELNVPATLIVDTDGRIIYKHAKRDYTQRAFGSDIINELKRVNN